MIVLPDFYDSFACKASSCRHTCCQGWEIDIDEVTAGNFLSMSGQLGCDLRRCVEEVNGQYSFILTEDEACPFLRNDKLCRIILEAGEEAIPDICYNHPRFFKMYGDCELGGIGLSCEAGCELLLRKAPGYMLDGQQMKFAELMEKLGVEYIAYDEQRKIDASYYDWLLEVMTKTEPIDDRWSQELMVLKKKRDELLVRLSLREKPRQLAWVYDYIAYRQLDEAASGIVFAYAQVMTDFVFVEAAATGDFPEALRRLSEQVEYSTENVDVIMKYISL